MTRVRTICLVALLVAVAGAGCRSVGPRTVARDRQDYSASISESWKRQTLLNIVKLRYLDPPIFVDVGQIVAGYSLEQSLTAGGSLPENGALGGNTATLGGSVKLTDRPTITYTPLTGNKFVKALMTPLQPDAVFFVVQSGYPADAVLFSTVGAMNGLKNQEGSLAGIAPAQPEYLRALELLRRIQLSGAVAMRIRQDHENQQSTLITFRSKYVSEQTLADIRELRRLLGLDQNASEFRLVFGSTATDDKELAVLTRSLLHIMNTMAAQVQVPPEDIADGRATPGFATEEARVAGQRLVQIRSSKDKPSDAHVAVNYHGHWFWIDDRDLQTKRTFAMIMLLFSLADTGEKEGLPLITIPAQ